MRKLVTVVFADVVGSTQLGELLDPEPLRELMLAAFRRIEGIVAHHGGTVEKFIGDAVMAVFGIPAAHEDDALRALRAAVEMRGAVAGGDDGIAARHGITLRLRIGVNSGEVMTGGGRQTLVTGDAVNLAARLEQHAAPGEILVGPVTASLVGDALAGDPVGPLTVKGKQAPVTAVRLRTLDDRPRPVAGSRRSTPLVGRDDEVARLDAALDTAVARGGPVVVTVLGGAGVGKSRLVEDCLMRWRSRTTPFVGRCPPYGRGITYWPLREAVQRRVRELSGADADPLDVLADVLSDVPGGRGLAAEVLGFVGLRPGAGTGDGTSAVRTLLEVVSRHRTLVVVLDDAQWAEPGLLDLVEHVLRWWHGGPLLAVVLARPELGRQRPDWPDVDLPNDTIRLAGLGDAAADRLARALLEDDADDRRARIVHAAGGNPLFIEELARVAASTPGDELPVLPAGVRTLLAARLDALTPPRRAVLQRAAVIGESFEDTSLAALTPAREVEDLPRRLDALVEDDLLRSDSAGTVGRHLFRHLVLRDVAYESLPKGERARLHHLLADEMVALADRTEVELDALVGHHLELAADLADEVGADPSEVATLATRAGHALHRAGLSSQARGDVPGTVNLLTRAAARLEGEDALPLVLGTLGSALTEAGDLATARSVLDRAVEVAEQRGDERARTHAGLFRLWWESAAEPAGWTVRARAEAGRAIDVATRLGDDLGLARAWVVLAEVAWSAGRFADVEDALERATVHARSVGDLREEAENVAALTATAVEGPLPVAAGIARCTATLAEHGANRSVRARTLRSLALLQAMDGQAGAARATIDASLAAFDELGQAYWLAVTTGDGGRIRWWAGDAAGARADLDRAMQRLEALGDRSQWARVAALAASLAALGDDLDTAERLVGESRVAADVDDLEPQVGWRLAAANLALARARPADAVTIATDAVDLSGGTDALPLRVVAAGVLLAAAEGAGDDELATSARRDRDRLAAAKGLHVVVGLMPGSGSTNS